MNGVSGRFKLAPGSFSILGPALLTLVILIVVVGAVIWKADGDPLALARLGSRYDLGDPQGSQGYDGQFVFYIARDLNPVDSAPHLDVPAYRYQRILLPLLGKIFSFGQLTWLPWTLAAIGILSHCMGTGVVATLLASWGANPWYALVYGLWAGFTLAVRLDLPEPLAYALLAGALLLEQRGKPACSWVLYGLALFAKETAGIVVAAALISSVFQRNWKHLAGLSLTAVLPYALFQVWLWQVFGQPGLGSGGAMATSFEFIPFMGLLRIGQYSLVYLAAMLLVFGPAILLPACWGVWTSIRQWSRQGSSMVGLTLLLNSLVIIFLPFSTYREPGGLLRFGCGLVFAVILYAGRYGLERVMRYSPLWVVMNTFMLKS